MELNLSEIEIPEKNQITYKYILKITYPIILSMFALNMMVFVDRAFVANYDYTQFAATLPASQIAATVASVFLGIIGFVSTLVSQYYGAEDYKGCSLSMWQGIYLSIVFTVFLLLIAPFGSLIFKVMGHTGDLLEFEKQYFFLILFASCVQLFPIAFSSLYRGIGETKITMYVGVITNLINVLLDWVLIFGKFGFPEMGGVNGSGLATLLSSVVSLIIYIILLNKKKIHGVYRVFGDRSFNKPNTFKLLKFGFPAGIQTFVGRGYFSILLLIIGKTGEFNLSCSNIAFTIEGISIFPVWGLGTAVSIIAGQERGAGRVNNIVKVLKSGALIGICFNILIIFLYNFFPEFLISIFAGGEESAKFTLIQNYTIPLIRWTSVWILLDTIHIVISSILRAVGDTVFMMIINMVVPLIFYIVLPYIMVVVLGLSLIWIWIELVVYTLIMFAIVLLRFYSGKWKEIEVI